MGACLVADQPFQRRFTFEGRLGDLDRNADRDLAIVVIDDATDPQVLSDRSFVDFGLISLHAEFLGQHQMRSVLEDRILQIELVDVEVLVGSRLEDQLELIPRLDRRLRKMDLPLDHAVRLAELSHRQRFVFGFDPT